MKWAKGNVLLILGVSFIVAGCSAQAQSQVQGETVVELKEYSIGSGEIQLAAWKKPVKVTIRNKGTDTHNFVIEELNVDTGLISPGDSVTLEISPEEAASLQAKCTLPGHTEAGMVAEVFINK